MAERRPLAAAVNQFAGADPEAVRAFITQETKPNEPTVDVKPALKDSDETEIKLHSSPRKSPTSAVSSRSPKKKPTRLQPVGLIPVTVRLRPEIAGALKRASLERQLSGEDVFTQQELVESVLEPWLAEEGYL